MSIRVRKSIAALLVGYLLFVAGIVYGMSVIRQGVIADLGTPQAQADWNAWRTEAAQQDGTKGPVQRSVPKSPEPPMLVLMRDYFPACVLGLLLPLSALYIVTTWMACGVLRQSGNSSDS
jgi:hypothetical protein